MNIEAFLLCDCATDTFGKLNLLGAFDTIYAKIIPATHQACAIAARIRFSKIELGQHHIKINIIDQDGNQIIPPLEGSIPVNFADNISSQAFNLILNIQRLKLENYGEYRVDLAIDNRHEASLPFFVSPPPQKPK